MLRLAKLFISLPVLTLPLWDAAPQAQAEVVMSQIDALRQLAKSRAADSKCRILPAPEAEELAGYLARAEIAAASRQSVGEVRSAISLGKTLGGTAACSANTSDEVKATLDAARQVVASAAKPLDEADDEAVVEAPVATDRKSADRRTQAAQCQPRRLRPAGLRLFRRAALRISPASRRARLLGRGRA